MNDLFKRQNIFLHGLIIALAGFLPGMAAGQTVVRNGGDPLMMVFAKAKDDARHMLLQIARTGISSQANGDARDFLLQVNSYGKPMYEVMAADIIASRHFWLKQTNDDRCAFTNDRVGDGRLNDIYLSIENCSKVLLAPMSRSLAVQTLIHESAHHFGIGDSIEDHYKADQIAITVTDAWLSARRSEQPHWESLPSGGAPSERISPSTIATGDDDDQAVANKVIVWGGCNTKILPAREDCGTYLNSGSVLTVTRISGSAQFDLQWKPMASDTAPQGRKFHTAVFTGNQPEFEHARNKMIVFGGCAGEGSACDKSFAVKACLENASETAGAVSCNDSRAAMAIYNLKNDTWERLAEDQAPEPRVFHGAVWTGSEMLVWGGLAGFRTQQEVPLANGASVKFSERYPAGEWTALPPQDFLKARFQHSAEWTEKDLIIWGGCGRRSLNKCREYFNDGAFYNVKDRQWRPMPRVTDFINGFEGRVNHSTVWTGRYLIIWGGESNGRILSNGAIFDSFHNNWRELSSVLPHSELGRAGHTAVFDALRGRMVIWGGMDSRGEYPTGTLVYEFGETGESWKILDTAGAPIGRKGHASIWTKDRLMVWGGFSANNDFESTGALFNP